MSCVTCHVSHVTIYFFFFDNVVKLIGGGSVINGAYPVQLVERLHDFFGRERDFICLEVA